MSRVLLAAMCFSLFIQPETVVKNCRLLCEVDGFQLRVIEHVWSGYTCVCSNGSSRSLSTPRTVWVEPLPADPEEKP